MHYSFSFLRPATVLRSRLYALAGKQEHSAVRSGSSVHCMRRTCSMHDSSAQGQRDAQAAVHHFSVLARDGDAATAAESLAASIASGIVSRQMAGAASAQSLRQLLGNASGRVGEREDGWDLLHELQQRSLVGKQQFTVTLQTCTGREEVQRVLRGMKQATMEPDAMLYSALYAALLSWRDLVPAVAVLAEAANAGVWSRREISGTAANSLRRLLEEAPPPLSSAKQSGTLTAIEGLIGERHRRAGGAMTGESWRYFKLLQLHGLAETSHLNFMLGHACDTAEEVASLYGGAQGTVTDGLVADRVTHQAAAVALMRVGDSKLAALAMRKATAGWGRKKTRQYVLKVIRPLRGEAMRGLFFALHGIGLTDRHSAKLALRACGGGQHAERLRKELAASGIELQ